MTGESVWQGRWAHLLQHTGVVCICGSSPVGSVAMPIKGAVSCANGVAVASG